MLASIIDRPARFGAGRSIIIGNHAKHPAIPANGQTDTAAADSYRKIKRFLHYIFVQLDTLHKQPSEQNKFWKLLKIGRIWLKNGNKQVTKPLQRHFSAV